MPDTTGRIRKRESARLRHVFNPDAEMLFFNVIVLKKFCRAPARTLAHLGRPMDSNILKWKAFINSPSRMTLLEATCGNVEDIDRIFTAAEEFARGEANNLAGALALSDEERDNVFDLS